MSNAQWLAFVAGLALGFGLWALVEVVDELRLRRRVRRYSKDW